MLNVSACAAPACRLTDIDAIIKKGERDTADLNQKMQQFTDNAMKFTMDGGMVYDFKDADDERADIGDLKAIMGACVRWAACRVCMCGLMGVGWFRRAYSVQPAAALERCAMVTKQRALCLRLASCARPTSCRTPADALPLLHSRAAAGSNWIDPPKRERKRHQLNYNDADYYKNALKTGAKDPRAQRLPKMPQLQDFQFFNVRAARGGVAAVVAVGDAGPLVCCSWRS